MPAIHELRDDFETSFAARLKRLASTPQEALALRSSAWVELIVESLREVGKARGLEVAPIRRGVGDIGWELAWGKNLSCDYGALSRNDPGDLFRLELALEVAEGSLLSTTKPERAIEEAAGDLAKLLWTRAPLKVLAFGARREGDAANALEAVSGGLGAVIAKRDSESDYLLVGLPNFTGNATVAPEQAQLWTRVVVRGKGEAPVAKTFAALLAG